MAKELVLKENVDILMGTINSATALAVSDFAKKEKIPFLVTNARTEKITGEKGHRYVFGIAENTAMAGRAAAFALAKNPSPNTGSRVMITNTVMPLPNPSGTD